VTYIKNIHGYKHYKHAVIINKNDFQRFKNYRNFKIIHANNASLLKKYRVSPFPKSNVKKNHRNEGQRYNFAKLDVQRRPAQTLVKKIEPNKLVTKKRTTLSKKPARKDVQHIGVQYPKKSEWVSPQKAKGRMNQISKAKTTKSQTRLAKRSLKAGAHLRTKDQMHARMGIEPKSRKELARPVTRKTSRTENHRFARSKIEKHWQERHPKPANEETFSWHDKDLATKQLNESLPPGLKAQLQSRQARGKANQNPSHKVRQSIKNEGQLRRGKIVGLKNSGFGGKTRDSLSGDFK